MSARDHSFGIDHPTVVPANFDPESAALDGNGSAGSASDGVADGTDGRSNDE